MPLSRRLILQYKVDLVCLQETKLQEVDSGFVEGFWAMQPSSGNSFRRLIEEGRLLCLWRKGFIQITSCDKGHNFICIAGRNVADDSVCVFLNVYAPCDRAGKRALWNSLSDLKSSYNPST